MSYMREAEQVEKVAKLGMEISDLQARCERLESENAFLRKMLEQNGERKPWRRNNAGARR